MAKISCCCCCCLVLMLVIVLPIVILCLIFLRQSLRLGGTDVTLTQFNLTDDNILHYNLTMNITVLNPNKRVGVYYDRIEASAYYQSKRFDTVRLTPFYQRPKNTSYLTPVFAGQRLVVLGDKEMNDFNKEKNSGVYSIRVNLDLKLRLKFGIMKFKLNHSPFTCDLKVPLANANGTSAGDTKVVWG